MTSLGAWVGLALALAPGVNREAAIERNNQAFAAIHQDHLAQAESLAQEALTIARQALPAGDPLVAAILNNLAQAERLQGNYLDAEKHYRAAIAIWETALGKQHPDTARGLMNLAALYHERGREAGAEDLYRRANAVFEEAYGKMNPLSLVTRNELGEVLRAEGRVSEAERLTRETLEPLKQILGDHDSRVIRALANYARLLKQTHHGAEAAAVRNRINGQAAAFR